jgi:hypothetical protein
LVGHFATFRDSILPELLWVSARSKYCSTAPVCASDAPLSKRHWRTQMRQPFSLGAQAVVAQTSCSSDAPVIFSHWRKLSQP